MTNHSIPRIIFFGTPTFALPSLEALIAHDYVPELIITNPDELIGRKQIMTPPPVKVCAQNHGIPVLQPIHLLHEMDNIPKADLYIVVAFGTIIPQTLINRPHLGTLNIHPSLLPRWRGASPIQSAILHGDATTGVTLMKVDERMDHGPIIHQQSFSLLEKKWTSPDLFDALARLGAHMLVDTLPKWIKNTITPVPQDDLRATYCKLIKKDHGRIPWSRSAAEIERMIRAYMPWPSAWTLWPGRDVISRIRIDEADVIDEESPLGSPGYTWQTAHYPLLIKTGIGSLVVRKITIEGKISLDPEAFLRGNPELLGATFV